MARFFKDMIEEYRKAKLEFRSFEPSYQVRVIKVRMICLGWFTFVWGGAGVFLCMRPYMDRRRLERGDEIEYRSVTDDSSVFYSMFARRKQLDIPTPEEYVESLGK